MFVEHLNQQLRVEALNEIGGTVERTMAKVTLNLNIKNTNFPAGKQVVIDHITIKNLPESSSWIAQNYTGALVSSEKQEVGVVAAASGYNFSSTNTFYVPEYLFDDPGKGAYIEIIGHINGESDRVAKYSVKLGDAMDEGMAYGNKYHITRNRHYTFTGDVKSYGETDGVAVKVTVAPWNTVSMDEETGRYITFGKVTDASGNTIAEGTNLDEMGTTLKVECSTNIGGWYTVTRNAKGAIVHQSAATAAVSAVASQSVSITIPPLGELPYLQSYTVSIYHHTIAQESVGPVASLHYSQPGGFIPNGRLSGWPADKLPPNGLQLAKRGNRLPSEMAGNNELTGQWKIRNTSTPGTAAGLGMGVSNTLVIAGLEHPAAQHCRDMGEGWFLPSKDEFMLIYGQKNALGTSYSLSGLYWSSTEAGEVEAWVATPTQSGVAYKNLKYNVRCVKAI